MILFSWLKFIIEKYIIFLTMTFNFLSRFKLTQRGVKIEITIWLTPMGYDLWVYNPHSKNKKDF